MKNPTIETKLDTILQYRDVQYTAYYSEDVNNSLNFEIWDDNDVYMRPDDSINGFDFKGETVESSGIFVEIKRLIDNLVDCAHDNLYRNPR